MKEYVAEVYDKEKNVLGEGPCFDPRYNRLSWVDINSCKLWTRIGDTKKCFEFDQPIGAALPLERSEGFLLCARDGLYVLEEGKISLLQDLTRIFKPFLRCNDAKADKRSRVWFGSSIWDNKYENQGNLYLYDKGNITVKQANTKISNGMAWTKDQKSFIFSDTLEHAIFKYDYDIESASITERRILFALEDGLPDGLCIDNEDNVWVAIWGGRRVEKRSSVTGEKLAVINVEAENVTSCCFGRGNLESTLFITTSGENLGGRYDGAVFKCEVDAKGVDPDYVRI